MSREVLDRLWASFRESAFRLETLQTYAVPQEDAAWQAFLRGRPVPARTPSTNPWLRRVASHRAAGRRIFRAHIVDVPLSPYIRFELQGYRDNQAAGEDIYITPRQAHPGLADLSQDWWLFDDHFLVIMHYNDDGEFLDAEQAPAGVDVGEYRRHRDLALRHGIALDDYLTTGREHRTA
jgi:hypothetical protein